MKTPATYSRFIGLLDNLPEEEQVRLLRLIITPRKLGRAIRTFHDETPLSPLDIFLDAILKSAKQRCKDVQRTNEPQV